MASPGTCGRTNLSFTWAPSLLTVNLTPIYDKTGIVQRIEYWIGNGLSAALINRFVDFDVG
jgi:hypothetical protein